MITKEILESHPVSVLKKELSKTNIKGYSKMKKPEIVSLMLKPEHSQRFSHIKKKGEAPKPEKKIVIKRTPKPEKKIVIKRTPKPEKKIVIKRTPKPEKKIVIKRTPKPTAPKPEKKIVIKKPRKETPGSIEASRIKKKIAIKKEKAPAKKNTIEEIRELYKKDPVINEGTITYPNKKGEMIKIRLPIFDEVFLKKPLRELGKDREDFLKGKYLLKKIGGGLYKSFTEKEVKRIFPENSANAIINYSDKYRKKIIFRREQKKKGKAPGPAKNEKEFTKEEVEEKYKDLGEFQKVNNKILERASFILTKDKNKIDKMIEVYKKINAQGIKGVSSNFNNVRSAIRDKLERDQNNCESLVKSLRTKINFIKKNGSKKDLPFGEKTVKSFLNEGHELIKKNSSCLNKKQLEEIKNLGIVTKTYYNNLTDTIKEEKEVKDEFLKLYPSKK